MYSWGKSDNFLTGLGTELPVNLPLRMESFDSPVHRVSLKIFCPCISIFVFSLKVNFVTRVALTLQEIYFFFFVYLTNI